MSESRHLRRTMVTTGKLAALDYRLEIRCRDCARTTIAGPAELQRMFPGATPLPEAARRLRCAGCGARDPRMWVWVMGWTREKGRRRG